MNNFKLSNKVLFIFTISVYLIALFIFGSWNYHYSKNEVMENIDRELYDFAVTLKYILPEDFHDRATDNQAISVEEDKNIARKLTKLVEETKLKYTYTIINKENELFFVASDITADPKTERETFYFYPYAEADESFINAFKKNEPTYITTSDQWGTVRTVMVPEESPGGVKYLACADYDISYVNGVLRRNLLRSIATILFFLLLAAPFLLIYWGLHRKYLVSLRESEEKFRLTYYTTPDSVNISRLEDGLYVDVNQGFIDLMGYSRDEVVGKTSLEIGVWHNESDRIKLIEKLKETGFCENLEAQFRKKNGGLITGQMSATIISFNGVPHIISITRDISKFKEMELQREQLVAELRVALNEVKTLRGFIPICSNCKKIRDDDGFWEQIEKYVSDHTDAQFSHSLCPDCIKKLYPEFSKD
jgi:PAS domain S-box-containing protein